MMHGEEADPPMWMLNRIVNPLVRALLRSPLHPLLSRRLVLLRVRVVRPNGPILAPPEGAETPRAR
jgi:hypothetical protein